MGFCILYDLKQTNLQYLVRFEEERRNRIRVLLHRSRLLASFALMIKNLLS